MPPFDVNLHRDTMCDVIRRWADLQPEAPALIAEAKAPCT